MSGATPVVPDRPIAEDPWEAGRSAERAGDSRAAASAYAEAFSRNPKSATCAMGLVRVLDALGERAQAERALTTFVKAANTQAAVAVAARQWEAWESTPRPGVPTIRVALLGTGTLASLGAHLRVACAGAGLHPAIHVAGFGQWAQEILTPDSPLHAFRPDLVIFAFAGASLFPRTIEDPDVDEDELRRERERGLAQVEAALDALHQHSPGAAALVHSFVVSDYSPVGVLDLKDRRGQRARVDALNDGLIALAEARPHVWLLDQERVEARHGKSNVRDDRLWYMASIPFADSFLPILASEYVRIIRPLRGLVRKCIVLDLDQTLWGGVVGEDGLEGLKLGGNDAAGNAFRDFQSALDRLRRRGIMLAVCSKNNQDDVWPVIDGHPDMVLRRQHFATWRINWLDKATNIRAIADELNLGLDSLVFIDDNPAERALVRQELPDVLTVDVPADPAGYVRTLLQLDVFESLNLTKEDRQRADMYVQARARRGFEERQETAGDLGAHLRELTITVSVESATAFSIPRVAQLVNKTNQFNLTTRRYSESHVRALVAQPDRWAVYTVSVGDRFGDLGLTGVAIVRIHADAWTIDSFLLSCRVLGRGVEDALLSCIARRARRAGASWLRGEFAPTAKNAPARGFYGSRGFSGPQEGLDGVSVFERSLEHDLPVPEWLHVVEAIDAR